MSIIVEFTASSEIQSARTLNSQGNFKFATILKNEVLADIPELKVITG